MSPTAALRQYQTENKLKKPPCTLQAMINLCNKFESTGSVLDKEKSGRPKEHNDEDERRIAGAVATLSGSNNWGVSSVRRVSNECGMKKSTVHRIMKTKLKLFKWKMKITQQLQPGDYDKRKKFAEFFMESMLDKIDNVLWTDEACFHLDGIIYTKNAYIWAAENPHAIIEKPLHSPKICVWVGFSAKIIIPPVIIRKDTIDGDKYHEILLKHVIPFLRRHRRCSSTVYQQDGAPPHIKNNVKKLLQKTFTDTRIISQHFPPFKKEIKSCNVISWGFSDAFFLIRRKGNIE